MRVGDLMKIPKIVGIVAVVGAIMLLGALISTMVIDLLQHGGAAQEAAQRAQCLNNLKQIGVAIALYAHPDVGGPSYGVFPPGTVANSNLPLDKRCGWASSIYLIKGEESSGFPTISSDLAWDDPAQPGAAGRDHEMFCAACPKPSAAKPVVPAAYVGIAGLGVDSPSLPTTHKRAGIFGDNRIVAPGDVTDGLAQTMMVVDSSAPAGPWYAGGRNTVRGLDPARQPYIGKNRQFGGSHVGVAMVLMADGSVRVVSDKVNPKVFEAMSTIAGGENISVP